MTHQHKEAGRTEMSIAVCQVAGQAGCQIVPAFVTVHVCACSLICMINISHSLLASALSLFLIFGNLLESRTTCFPSDRNRRCICMNYLNVGWPLHPSCRMDIAEWIISSVANRFGMVRNETAIWTFACTQGSAHIESPEHMHLCRCTWSHRAEMQILRDTLTHIHSLFPHSFLSLGLPFFNLPVSVTLSTPLLSFFPTTYPWPRSSPNEHSENLHLPTQCCPMSVNCSLQTAWQSWWIC